MGEAAEAVAVEQVDLVDLADQPDPPAATSLPQADLAARVLPPVVEEDAVAELLAAAVAVAEAVGPVPAGEDVARRLVAAAVARQIHGESARSHSEKASITCRCWVPS